MRILTTLVVAAILLVAAPMAADALPLPGPVPSTNYITLDGLDWAWASAYSDFCCGTYDIDAPGDGWRVATDEEWANRPEVSDFGTADNFKCAGTYFTSYAGDCNYFDAVAGYLTRDAAPNAGLGVNGLNCNNTPCEIWVVRGESDGGNHVGVPAPAALVLLGLGLVVAAPVLRRRR